MATSVRRRVKGKATKWTGYHRILWPTDFSALAKAALSHSVGLASEAGAELVLLHACCRPSRRMSWRICRPPSGPPSSGRPGRPSRGNLCGSKRRSRDRTVGRVRS